MTLARRALLWLCAATLAATGIVRADPIVNTATVSWDNGGRQVLRASNTVTLTVERAPDRPVIATFQPATGPGAILLPMGDTQCRVAGADRQASLPPVYSNETAPASVVATDRVQPGLPLGLSVASGVDNRDASRIETLTVTVVTNNGDRETLTFRETAANSGVFAGMVPTAPNPPAPRADDCTLSIDPLAATGLTLTRTSDSGAFGTTTLTPIATPTGRVFDSATGAPVAGATVTLLDAATRQPATVFAPDGVTPFPASIVTGQPVTDAAGTPYPLGPGDYRFPVVPPGTYILVVTPPGPYQFPSGATADAIGALGIALGGGSFGQPFTLVRPGAVADAIPLDVPVSGLTLRKQASATLATPGEAVQYRITVANSDATRATGTVTLDDRLPDAMRLQPDTVRIDGVQAPYTVSADGRALSVAIAPLPPNGQRVVSYLLQVRPDAVPGDALNRAQARDSAGVTSAVADARVRIVRDAIADRMTIVGRVVEGDCTVDRTDAPGIAGVRVLLEDGSYAVTDEDGRYHFEGVTPGTHVVQIEPATLGPGRRPTDCAANARSGRNGLSRFVEGMSGGVYRADFRAVRDGAVALIDPPTRHVASDPEASGAARDWFTGQTPGVDWLFPAADHNPRTRAVRVAIKHVPGQTVTLFANGRPIDRVAFDGARNDATGTIAVSTWGAIGLGERVTRLHAEVRNPDGTLAERLSRNVHYASNPFQATLVRDASTLVADGVTRPVIVLRMTDRNGRPVHHGAVGEFDLPAPYRPAQLADAQSVRQLAGLERARATWRVEGDAGLAYVTLEPTTASGALTLTLPFRDGDVQRTVKVEAWLNPGNRPWTVVGFAAGTAGFNTLNRNLDRLGATGDATLTEGRIALYAKGRVKGKWLMTLAYDTAKREETARFAGVIDPNAYYTVYADRTERRYDAASTRKLYLRLERPQFLAMFGDFDTGLNDAQLTRYNRALNGVKAQYRSDRVTATAFAADTPFTHRRDELQGTGLSGPYVLGSRFIVPNSETIVVETRDRLRSERIVARQPMIRHIDYDIDYRTGTLLFRAPVLSRSSTLDPQFIVADYEVDGVATRRLNAGGRVAWTNAARTLKVGATALHDEGQDDATQLGGVDVRWTPTPATEVRAELAGSRGGGTSASAWLIEAEHHGRRLDLVAYAREQGARFGVGQTNAVEAGTRKIGADARMRVTTDLAVVASAWRQENRASGAARTAVEAKATYQTRTSDLRAGLTAARDTLADGRTVQSTLVALGATQRLFDNRIELDVQSELPIGGADDSIDLPTRHVATARWAIAPAVTLIGSYELAQSAVIDARTARIGFDLKPWAGARFLATAHRQDVDEYGPRSFASLGLAQSVPLGKRWTVDLTLDASRPLSPIDPARVIAPLHPVAVGGSLAPSGVIDEAFTAMTAGATYRGERWSATARIEHRAGTLTDREGVTASILRQLGEGRVLAGQGGWFRARGPDGLATESAQAAISWAHRPDASEWTFLSKLELRHDRVAGAVAGQPGPIGGALLLVTGSAASTRIVSSIAVNYVPAHDRHEVALFWGSRWVSDRIDRDDLRGWSNIVGADLRFDLGRVADVGVSATARATANGAAWSVAGGPTISVSPVKNSYVTLGYNITGFRDRDFADARYTRSGPYVTMRLKFDQDTLGGLFGRR